MPVSLSSSHTPVRNPGEKTYRRGEGDSSIDLEHLKIPDNISGNSFGFLNEMEVEGSGVHVSLPLSPRTVPTREKVVAEVVIASPL